MLFWFASKELSSDRVLKMNASTNNSLGSVAKIFVVEYSHIRKAVTSTPVLGVSLLPKTIFHDLNVPCLLICQKTTKPSKFGSFTSVIGLFFWFDLQKVKTCFTCGSIHTILVRTTQPVMLLDLLHTGLSQSRQI